MRTGASRRPTAISRSASTRGSGGGRAEISSALKPTAPLSTASATVTTPVARRSSRSSNPTMPGGQAGVESRPRTGIWGAREESFLIDEISKSLRLAPERADQVTIIDGVGALAVRSHPRHAHDRIRPEETFKPIVEEMHLDHVADKARRDGVVDSIDSDGAIARRFHRHRCEVGGPPLGQGFELLALDRDERRATGVVTVADAVDKGAVGFKADEISALPPPEPLVEADLDMAVGRLDAPVLIGHARIITGRLHAVMPAQLVITLGEIELCVAVEIFEGGRQRVGPMLPWDASELPKRILQPLGDG